MNLSNLTSLTNKWVGEFGIDEVILEYKNILFSLEQDKKHNEAKSNTWIDSEGGINEEH